MLLLLNNIDIRMDIADLSLDELLDLIHRSSPELQETLKHACGSVLQNKVKVDVHFKHSFNLMVSCPSQSGKIGLLKRCSNTSKLPRTRHIWSLPTKNGSPCTMKSKSEVL